MFQKITLSYEQTQELINELQGSCKSLNEVLYELFKVISFTDLDIKNLSEIDFHIFLCDSCGWWYDLGEQSSIEEDNVCTDCESEYLEYDED